MPQDSKPESAVCAYCGKDKPISELYRDTIRVLRSKRWQDQEGWYCRGANCHGYHQMAQEG